MVNAIAIRFRSINQLRKQFSRKLSIAFVKLLPHALILLDRTTSHYGASRCYSSINTSRTLYRNTNKWGHAVSHFPLPDQPAEKENGIVVVTIVANKFLHIFGEVSIRDPSNRAVVSCGTV